MRIFGQTVARPQHYGYHDLVRLAELIKEEREKRHWSQRQLAARAGVDPSAVSRIERGLQIGHADTLVKIAAALGIPPSVLHTALREEGMELEIQQIDLSKVPPSERPTLRRAIEALVRAWEREGQGEG